MKFASVALLLVSGSLSFACKSRKNEDGSLLEKKNKKIVEIATYKVKQLDIKDKPGQPIATTIMKGLKSNSIPRGNIVIECHDCGQDSGYDEARSTYCSIKSGKKVLLELNDADARQFSGQIHSNEEVDKDASTFKKMQDNAIDRDACVEYAYAVAIENATISCTPGTCIFK